MIDFVSKPLTIGSQNKRGKCPKKEENSEKGRIIVHGAWELSEIIKAIEIARAGGNEFISFDMSKDTWVNEKYILERLKDMRINAEHKGNGIVVNLKGFSITV